MCFLFLFFFHCLFDTNKQSSWRSKYWSNSTQGAHSHLVIDVWYLWDNGLMGISYEKDSGVGLKRTLLKFQHYWACSPLSLLEHNNETVKRTCKELGYTESYYTIPITDLWVNKEAKILVHFLWRLYSFIVKNPDLISKFYLKLEAM